MTIGVDPHKQTHTAAAVNDLGVEVEHLTAAAGPTGNGQLLEWARALDTERVWAVEDVRNVSGSLERFLIDRGETVVRLAPQLMAGARRTARTRGKSDPIDALAIARAALREGVQNLPTARLAGPEREIRQLAMYRERLLDMRTRLVNELRWQLHDLWPDWDIPARALTQPGWQTKVACRLARAEQTVQVIVARDMIRRARELSSATKDLYDKIAALVRQVAPQLLAEPGIGVLLAAKFIGEIAGITRFTTDAQLARLAGCAPIPAPPDAPTATASIPAATAGSTAPSTCSRSSESAPTPAPPSTSKNNAPTARPKRKPSATSNATSSAASTTSSTTPTVSRPPPSA